jgi:DNA-binding IclR family transcriptional regulator
VPRLAWRYRSELASLYTAVVLLAAVIGRAKTWVYERLQELERHGQVERARHGRWRLTHPTRAAATMGDRPAGPTNRQAHPVAAARARDA